MLAQNFKTPADLQISDAEFEALVKVLGMLERGEIEQRDFAMNIIGNPECGTPACLCGWARHVSHGAAFPPQHSYGRQPRWKQMPYHLRRLFAWVETFADEAPHKATPAQGAIALRSYLSTGEPKWAEALEG